MSSLGPWQIALDTIIMTMVPLEIVYAYIFGKDWFRMQLNFLLWLVRSPVNLVRSLASRNKGDQS
ncbi:hypothetical protein MUP37_07340 [Candidatus Bathyarchaeota archaeon]|jgi:hypothetical protein|nr:hypothetical protein [Candidatus Bathyarchaeota archaeon]